MGSLYSKERTLWQNDKGNLVVDLGPVKLEIASELYHYKLWDVESYNNKTGELVIDTDEGLLIFDLEYEMEDLGLDKKLDISYVLGNIESFRVVKEIEKVSLIIDDLTFTVLKQDKMVCLYVRDNNDYLNCVKYVYEGNIPKFSSGTVEDFVKMQKIQKLVDTYGAELYRDFMNK